MLAKAVDQSTEMSTELTLSRASPLPQGGCGLLEKSVAFAEVKAAAQLGIRSIPSLILFKNGKELARQSGALPLPQLLAWLRSQGI